jgi:3-hydroxyisobutyrate dehydrogenase-like beta-hydroxyacid dehydrogenase
MVMKVAVLGMGRMGQALAGRLVDAGHDLVIWNRTPGKVPDLVARGAEEAASVAAAVGPAQVVLSSLTNDEVVRQVACGEGGVLASLGEGCLYVDTSTVSPALTTELDAVFPRFVAMPILGSPAMVAAGHAVYLVGGEEGPAPGLAALLPSLSERVLRYEVPPLASAAKLAVNLLLLDAVVALAESFAVGRAGGLSEQQLRDLLGQSPMVPPALANRFEGVLTGHQDPWWSPGLGAKDAGLAIDLAATHGSSLPATAAVRRLYDQAATDPANHDIADVTRLYPR